MFFPQLLQGNTNIMQEGKKDEEEEEEEEDEEKSGMI